MVLLGDVSWDDFLLVYNIVINFVKEYFVQSIWCSSILFLVKIIVVHEYSLVLITSFLIVFYDDFEKKKGLLWSWWPVGVFFGCFLIFLVFKKKTKLKIVRFNICTASGVTVLRLGLSLISIGDCIC